MVNHREGYRVDSSPLNPSDVLIMGRHITVGKTASNLSTEL